MPARAGQGWEKIDMLPPGDIDSPSPGTQTEELYGRDSPHPLMAVLSPPRVSLLQLVSLTARRPHLF